MPIHGAVWRRYDEAVFVTDNSGMSKAKLYFLTAEDPQPLEHVRGFFREYLAGLGVDTSFQDIDKEMAELPGDYAAPRGALIYAELNGRPAGCVGIRPLSDTICELKRLYVSPEFRGHGVGHELVIHAIQTARKFGYLKIMLDTIPSMRIAIKLYRELGFQEAPAYYQAPAEGTQFLALDLENWTNNDGHNDELSHLFDFNAAWARQMTQVDPEYFEKLSKLQLPEYLWIGCSDSRVPANQIVGLLPGEVFVHRNIANLVIHTDLNCLSVTQFAIDVLKVKHIMVVGHYGCGGIGAALTQTRVGLADLWLQHIQDVHAKYRPHLDALPEHARHDKLCELNVIEQVMNLCSSVVVRDAWQRGQQFTIHGWIYSLNDGSLRNLGITVSAEDNPATVCAKALRSLGVN